MEKEMVPPRFTVGPAGVAVGTTVGVAVGTGGRVAAGAGVAVASGFSIIAVAVGTAVGLGVAVGTAVGTAVGSAPPPHALTTRANTPKSAADAKYRIFMASPSDTHFWCRVDDNLVPVFASVNSRTFSPSPPRVAVQVRM
jgi:hypothetical protein